MEDEWGSGERETLALHVVTTVTSAQPRPVGDEQRLPGGNPGSQQRGKRVQSHTPCLRRSPARPGTHGACVRPSRAPWAHHLRGLTWAPRRWCARAPGLRNAALPLKRLGLLLKPALGVRGSTPGPRESGPEAEQVLRRHWRSVNTPGCSLPRASLPATPCTGDSSCGSCTQRPLFLSLTHSLTHTHNRPLSQTRGDEHGPLSPATCAFSLPAAPRPCGFGPVAQGPFSRLKRHGGDGGLVGRWRGLRGVFTPVVGAPLPSPVPPVPPGGPQNCWGEGNTRPLHPALGPAGLVDSRTFLSAGQPRGQEAEDAEIEMHSQPVAPFAL